MGNLLASCGLKRSTKIGSTTDYQSDSSDDATVLLGRGSITAQQSSQPPVSAGARGGPVFGTAHPMPMQMTMMSPPTNIGGLPVIAQDIDHFPDAPASYSVTPLASGTASSRPPGQQQQHAMGYPMDYQTAFLTQHDMQYANMLEAENKSDGQRRRRQTRCRRSTPSPPQPHGSEVSPQPIRRPSEDALSSRNYEDTRRLPAPESVLNDNSLVHREVKARADDEVYESVIYYYDGPSSDPSRRVKFPEEEFTGIDTERQTQYQGSINHDEHPMGGYSGAEYLVANPAFSYYLPSSASKFLPSTLACPTKLEPHHVKQLQKTVFGAAVTDEHQTVFINTQLIDRFTNKIRQGYFAINMVPQPSNLNVKRLLDQSISIDVHQDSVDMMEEAELKSFRYFFDRPHHVNMVAISQPTGTEPDTGERDLMTQALSALQPQSPGLLLYDKEDVTAHFRWLVEDRERFMSCYFQKLHNPAGMTGPLKATDYVADYRSPPDNDIKEALMELSTVIYPGVMGEAKRLTHIQLQQLEPRHSLPTPVNVIYHCHTPQYVPDSRVRDRILTVLYDLLARNIPYFPCIIIVTDKNDQPGTFSFRYLPQHPHLPKTILSPLIDCLPQDASVITLASSFEISWGNLVPEFSTPQIMKQMVVLTTRAVELDVKIRPLPIGLLADLASRELVRLIINVKQPKSDKSAAKLMCFMVDLIEKSFKASAVTDDSLQALMAIAEYKRLQRGPGVLLAIPKNHTSYTFNDFQLFYVNGESVAISDVALLTEPDDHFDNFRRRRTTYLKSLYDNFDINYAVAPETTEQRYLLVSKGIQIDTDTGHGIEEIHQIESLYEVCKTQPSIRVILNYATGVAPPTRKDCRVLEAAILAVLSVMHPVTAGQLIITPITQWPSTISDFRFDYTVMGRLLQSYKFGVIKPGMEKEVMLLVSKAYQIDMKKLIIPEGLKVSKLFESTIRVLINRRVGNKTVEAMAVTAIQSMLNSLDEMTAFDPYKLMANVVREAMMAIHPTVPGVIIATPKEFCEAEDYPADFYLHYIKGEQVQKYEDNLPDLLDLLIESDQPPLIQKELYVEYDIRYIPVLDRAKMVTLLAQSILLILDHDTKLKLDTSHAQSLKRINSLQRQISYLEKPIIRVVFNQQFRHTDLSATMVSDIEDMLLELMQTVKPTTHATIILTPRKTLSTDQATYYLDYIVHGDLVYEYRSERIPSTVFEAEEQSVMSKVIEPELSATTIGVDQIDKEETDSCKVNIDNTCTICLRLKGLRNTSSSEEVRKQHIAEVINILEPVLYTPDVDVVNKTNGDLILTLTPKSQLRNPLAIECIETQSQEKFDYLLSQSLDMSNDYYSKEILQNEPTDGQEDASRVIRINIMLDTTAQHRVCDVAEEARIMETIIRKLLKWGPIQHGTVVVAPSNSADIEAKLFYIVDESLLDYDINLMERPHLEYIKYIQRDSIDIQGEIDRVTLAEEESKYVRVQNCFEKIPIDLIVNKNKNAPHVNLGSVISQSITLLWKVKPSQPGTLVVTSIDRKQYTFQFRFDNPLRDYSIKLHPKPDPTKLGELLANAVEVKSGEYGNVHTTESHNGTGIDIIRPPLPVDVVLIDACDPQSRLVLSQELSDELQQILKTTRPKQPSTIIASLTDTPQGSRMKFMYAPDFTMTSYTQHAIPNSEDLQSSLMRSSKLRTGDYSICEVIRKAEHDSTVSTWSPYHREVSISVLVDGGRGTDNKLCLLAAPILKALKTAAPSQPGILTIDTVGDPFNPKMRYLVSEPEDKFVLNSRWVDKEEALNFMETSFSMNDLSPMRYNELKQAEAEQRDVTQTGARVPVNLLVHSGKSPTQAMYDIAVKNSLPVLRAIDPKVPGSLLIKRSSNTDEGGAPYEAFYSVNQKPTLHALLRLFDASNVRNLADIQYKALPVSFLDLESLKEARSLVERLAISATTKKNPLVSVIMMDGIGSLHDKLLRTIEDLVATIDPKTQISLVVEQFRGFPGVNNDILFYLSETPSDFTRQYRVKVIEDFENCLRAQNQTIPVDIANPEQCIPLIDGMERTVRSIVDISKAVEMQIAIEKELIHDTTNITALINSLLVSINPQKPGLWFVSQGNTGFYSIDYAVKEVGYDYKMSFLPKTNVGCEVGAMYQVKYDIRDRHEAALREGLILNREDGGAISIDVLVIGGFPVNSAGRKALYSSVDRALNSLQPTISAKLYLMPAAKENFDVLYDVTSNDGLNEDEESIIYESLNPQYKSYIPQSERVVAADRGWDEGMFSSPVEDNRDTDESVYQYYDQIPSGSRSRSRKRRKYKLRSSHSVSSERDDIKVATETELSQAEIKYDTELIKDDTSDIEKLLIKTYGVSLDDDNIEILIKEREKGSLYTTNQTPKIDIIVQEQDRVIDIHTDADVQKLLRNAHLTKPGIVYFALDGSRKYLPVGYTSIPVLLPNAAEISKLNNSLSDGIPVKWGENIAHESVMIEEKRFTESSEYSISPNVSIVFRDASGNLVPLSDDIRNIFGRELAQVIEIVHPGRPGCLVLELIDNNGVELPSYHYSVIKNFQDYTGASNFAPDYSTAEDNAANYEYYEVSSVLELKKKKRRKVRRSKVIKPNLVSPIHFKYCDNTELLAHLCRKAMNITTLEENTKDTIQARNLYDVNIQDQLEPPNIILGWAQPDIPADNAGLCELLDTLLRRLGVSKSNRLEGIILVCRDLTSFDSMKTYQLYFIEDPTAAQYLVDVVPNPPPLHLQAWMDRSITINKANGELISSLLKEAEFETGKQPHAPPITIDVVLKNWHHVHNSEQVLKKVQKLLPVMAPSLPGTMIVTPMPGSEDGYSFNYVVNNIRGDYKIKHREFDEKAIARLISQSVKIGVHDADRTYERVREMELDAGEASYPVPIDVIVDFKAATSIPYDPVTRFVAPDTQQSIADAAYDLLSCFKPTKCGTLILTPRSVGFEAYYTVKVPDVYQIIFEAPRTKAEMAKLFKRAIAVHPDDPDTLERVITTEREFNIGAHSGSCYIPIIVIINTDVDRLPTEDEEKVALEQINEILRETKTSLPATIVLTPTPTERGMSQNYDFQYVFDFMNDDYELEVVEMTMDDQLKLLAKGEKVCSNSPDWSISQNIRQKEFLYPLDKNDQAVIQVVFGGEKPTSDVSYLKVMEKIQSVLKQLKPTQRGVLLVTQIDPETFNLSGVYVVESTSASYQYRAAEADYETEVYNLLHDQSARISISNITEIQQLMRNQQLNYLEKRITKKVSVKLLISYQHHTEEQIREELQATSRVMRNSGIKVPGLMIVGGYLDAERKWKKKYIFQPEKMHINTATDVDHRPNGQLPVGGHENANIIYLLRTSPRRDLKKFYTLDKDNPAEMRSIARAIHETYIETQIPDRRQTPIDIVRNGPESNLYKQDNAYGEHSDWMDDMLHSNIIDKVTDIEVNFSIMLPEHETMTVNQKEDAIKEVKDFLKDIKLKTPGHIFVMPSEGPLDYQTKMIYKFVPARQTVNVEDIQQVRAKSPETSDYQVILRDDISKHQFEDMLGKAISLEKSDDHIYQKIKDINMSHTYISQAVNEELSVKSHTGSQKLGSHKRRRKRKKKPVTTELPVKALATEMKKIRLSSPTHLLHPPKLDQRFLQPDRDATNYTVLTNSLTQLQEGLTTAMKEITVELLDKVRIDQPGNYVVKPEFSIGKQRIMRLDIFQTGSGELPGESGSTPAGFKPQIIVQSPDTMTKQIRFESANGLSQEMYEPPKGEHQNNMTPEVNVRLSVVISELVSPEHQNNIKDDVVRQLSRAKLPESGHYLVMPEIAGTQTQNERPRINLSFYKADDVDLDDYVCVQEPKWNSNDLTIVDGGSSTIKEIQFNTMYQQDIKLALSMATPVSMDSSPRTVTQNIAKRELHARQTIENIVTPSTTAKYILMHVDEEMIAPGMEDYIKEQTINLIKNLDQQPGHYLVRRDVKLSESSRNPIVTLVLSTANQEKRHPSSQGNINMTKPTQVASEKILEFSQMGPTDILKNLANSTPVSIMTNEFSQIADSSSNTDVQHPIEAQNNATSVRAENNTPIYSSDTFEKVITKRPSVKKRIKRIKRAKTKSQVSKFTILHGAAETLDPQSEELCRNVIAKRIQQDEFKPGEYLVKPEIISSMKGQKPEIKLQYFLADAEDAATALPADKPAFSAKKLIEFAEKNDSTVQHQLSSSKPVDFSQIHVTEVQRQKASYILDAMNSTTTIESLSHDTQKRARFLHDLMIRMALSLPTPTSDIKVIVRQPTNEAKLPIDNADMRAKIHSLLAGLQIRTPGTVVVQGAQYFFLPEDLTVNPGVQKQIYSEMEDTDYSLKDYSIEFEDAGTDTDMVLKHGYILNSADAAIAQETSREIHRKYVKVENASDLSAPLASLLPEDQMNIDMLNAIIDAMPVKEIKLNIAWNEKLCHLSQHLIQTLVIRCIEDYPPKIPGTIVVSQYGATSPELHFIAHDDTFPMGSQQNYFTTGSHFTTQLQPMDSDACQTLLSKGKPLYTQESPNIEENVARIHRESFHVKLTDLEITDQLISSLSQESTKDKIAQLDPSSALETELSIQAINELFSRAIESTKRPKITREESEIQREIKSIVDRIQPVTGGTLIVNENEDGETTYEFSTLTKSDFGLRKPYQRHIISDTATEVMHRLQSVSLPVKPGDYISKQIVSDLESIAERKWRHPKDVILSVVLPEMKGTSKEKALAAAKQLLDSIDPQYPALLVLHHTDTNDSHFKFGYMLDDGLGNYKLTVTISKHAELTQLLEESIYNQEEILLNDNQVYGLKYPQVMIAVTVMIDDQIKLSGASIERAYKHAITSYHPYRSGVLIMLESTEKGNDAFPYISFRYISKPGLSYSIRGVPQPPDDLLKVMMKFSLPVCLDDHFTQKRIRQIEDSIDCPAEKLELIPMSVLNMGTVILSPQQLATVENEIRAILTGMQPTRPATIMVMNDGSYRYSLDCTFVDFANRKSYASTLPILNKMAKDFRQMLSLTGGENDIKRRSIEFQQELKQQELMSTVINKMMEIKQAKKHSQVSVGRILKDFSKRLKAEKRKSVVSKSEKEEPLKITKSISQQPGGEHTAQSKPQRKAHNYHIEALQTPMHTKVRELMDKAIDVTDIQNGSNKVRARQLNFTFEPFPTIKVIRNIPAAVFLSAMDTKTMERDILRILTKIDPASSATFIVHKSQAGFTYHYHIEGSSKKTKMDLQCAEQLTKFNRKEEIMIDPNELLLSAKTIFSEQLKEIMDHYAIDPTIDVVYDSIDPTMRQQAARKKALEFLTHSNIRVSGVLFLTFNDNEPCIFSFAATNTRIKISNTMQESQTKALRYTLNTVLHMTAYKDHWRQARAVTLDPESGDFKVQIDEMHMRSIAIERLPSITIPVSFVDEEEDEQSKGLFNDMKPSLKKMMEMIDPLMPGTLIVSKHPIFSYQFVPYKITQEAGRERVNYQTNIIPDKSVGETINAVSHCIALNPYVLEPFQARINLKEMAKFEHSNVMANQRCQVLIPHHSATAERLAHGRHQEILENMFQLSIPYHWYDVLVTKPIGSSDATQRINYHTLPSLTTEANFTPNSVLHEQYDVQYHPPPNQWIMMDMVIGAHKVNPALCSRLAKQHRPQRPRLCIILNHLLSDGPPNDDEKIKLEEDILAIANAKCTSDFCIIIATPYHDSKSESEYIYHIADPVNTDSIDTDIALFKFHSNNEIKFTPVPSTAAMLKLVSCGVEVSEVAEHSRITDSFHKTQNSRWRGTRVIVNHRGPHLKSQEKTIIAMAVTNILRRLDPPTDGYLIVTTADPQQQLGPTTPAFIYTPMISQDVTSLNDMIPDVSKNIIISVIPKLSDSDILLAAIQSVRIEYPVTEQSVQVIHESEKLITKSKDRYVVVKVMLNEASILKGQVAHDFKQMFSRICSIISSIKPTRSAFLIITPSEFVDQNNYEYHYLVAEPTSGYTITPASTTLAVSDPKVVFHPRLDKVRVLACVRRGVRINKQTQAAYTKIKAQEVEYVKNHPRSKNYQTVIIDVPHNTKRPSPRDIETIKIASDRMIGWLEPICSGVLVLTPQITDQQPKYEYMNISYTVGLNNHHLPKLSKQLDLLLKSRVSKRNKPDVSQYRSYNPYNIKASLLPNAHDMMQLVTKAKLVNEVTPSVLTEVQRREVIGNTLSSAQPITNDRHNPVDIRVILNTPKNDRRLSTGKLEKVAEEITTIIHSLKPAVPGSLIVTPTHGAGQRDYHYCPDDPFSLHVESTLTFATAFSQAERKAPVQDQRDADYEYLVKQNITYRPIPSAHEMCQLAVTSIPMQDSAEMMKVTEDFISRYGEPKNLSEDNIPLQVIFNHSNTEATESHFKEAHLQMMQLIVRIKTLGQGTLICTPKLNIFAVEETQLLYDYHFSPGYLLEDRTNKSQTKTTIAVPGRRYDVVYSPKPAEQDFKYVLKNSCLLATDPNKAFENQEKVTKQEKYAAHIFQFGDSINVKVYFNISSSQPILSDKEINDILSNITGLLQSTKPTKQCIIIVSKTADDLIEYYFLTNPTTFIPPPTSPPVFTPVQFGSQQ